MALLQAALVTVLWIVLGYWNARQAWLLEPPQQDVLRLFFFRELPILGLVALIALPALSIFRLADEASLDVAHEPEFLDRLLGYPRAVAVLDMAASAIFFFLGAMQLRVMGQAPAIEAAKIVVFGFLTGVLFGVAAFFLLQTVLRPLLVSVAERGGHAASRTAFPLTQKIIASCIALAFVVTGLVGEIALSWAQRFAEASTSEASRERLRGFAVESAGLRDAAGWKAFFAKRRPSPESGTLLVMSREGLRVAMWPPKPPRADAVLVASDEWREAVGRIGRGTIVARRGENRVVTVVTLPTGWLILELAPPDARVLRSFAASVAPIGVEILFLSLALAWAVGRGITRPVRDLERRTRRFGEDPGSVGETLPPTDDEIGGLVGSFARMENEIRAIQEQLRVTERRAATAELLAGVAHEVRNPLFGITSTAAALEGELAGNNALAPHLAVIRKESDRLARMMEEMLALQRAPHRSGVAAPLLPVLERAAAAVRSRFASRAPKIGVEAPFDLEIADADREKLESVFGNLFENAVLCAERPVRVSCFARRAGGGAVVTVEDDGPGLPADVRERVFEPFVTSRPGGTGIGLAVCRQIVLEHGGTISVDSRDGGPTIFTVTLPAK
ncbi:MAG TPA: HAMP domain-containing sensor histidine kinase [Thermoanaerobaculia bacterium]|nr:HAMP domain-containing sensor histidine kinase [Thermoanaerobaculia bacterium]